MVAAVNVSGQEVNLDRGCYFVSLKPYCVPLPYRAPRNRKQVPGLYWKWVIALKLREEHRLTYWEIARQMETAPGHAMRMIKKTRQRIAEIMAVDNPAELADGDD